MICPSTKRSAWFCGNKSRYMNATGPRQKEVSDAQRQAGRDWFSSKIRRRAEIQRSILAFVKLNPGSTSDDIWIATGYSWDYAAKFLKRFRRKRDNRMVYRVNYKALASYLSK